MPGVVVFSHLGFENLVAQHQFSTKSEKQDTYLDKTYEQHVAQVLSGEV